MQTGLTGQPRARTDRALEVLNTRVPEKANTWRRSRVGISTTVIIPIIDENKSMSQPINCSETHSLHSVPRVGDGRNPTNL